MFNNILNKFSFKKNNLISNFTPLTFNEKLNFSKKKEISVLDLNEEILDLKSGIKKKEIYEIYLDSILKYDKLLFESSNISSDIINLKPGFLGREYNKTNSILFNICGDFKEVVLEVLNGTGFALIESIFDVSNIKIISLKNKSKVLIPKGYALTLINTSNNESLICNLLRSSKVKYNLGILKELGGSTLFYIKNKGFVKNENISPFYHLEEVEGNFTGNYLFDEEKGLYKEFSLLPEKFNFLNN